MLLADRAVTLRLRAKKNAMKGYHIPTGKDNPQLKLIKLATTKDGRVERRVLSFIMSNKCPRNPSHAPCVSEDCTTSCLFSISRDGRTVARSVICQEMWYVRRVFS